MKLTLTSLPFLTLISTSLAKNTTFFGDVVKFGPKDTVLSPIGALTLNESVDVIVPFRDLWFLTPIRKRDPRDTLVFVIDTSNSTIDKRDQKIVLDITGIRKSVKKVHFSVRGCDVNGENCIPRTDSKITTFDNKALKSKNKVSLNVGDFGITGKHFYVYLQVPEISGKDNLNYGSDTDTNRPVWARFGEKFYHIIGDRMNDWKIAVTLSLESTKASH